MTFLNPFALLGLLAAAIPVLLHLLNLRKLQTIEFSTLAFLKELEKTKIRRLKIRQILLLILRTLLVVMLALAFARPTLKGSIAGTIGSNARTSAVIILDDSFSMTSEDQHGELLKQARQAARELTSVFQEGDEVMFLPLSHLSLRDTGRGATFRDFSQLRDQLERVRPSPVHRQLDDAVRVAARMLTGTQNFNKEVYLLSDFQQGVVSGHDITNNNPEQLFPPETRVFEIPFGSRDLRNFGLESVSIPTSIFEPHRPFTVQARVGNFSDHDAQDRVVSVFLNGSRVAERSIDIPRRSVVPVEFSVAADTVGILDGFVELEHDDAEYDNRRYFSLRIPERTNILLVGAGDQLQLVRLALEASKQTGTEQVLAQTTAAKLSSVDIKRADVIILAGTEGFAASQLSELSAFVKSGGGIILFPSTRVEPLSFNRNVAPVLGVPQMEAIDRPAPTTGASAGFVEFGQAELAHPLFEGIFEPSSRNTSRSASAGREPAEKLESPRIIASAKFAPAAQSRSIITLTNGAPFLLEQESGTGKILVCAVPPVLEWSDFPTRGLFVPLMHRSILYLARQQSKAVETLPGSEVLLTSSAASTGPWYVETPQRLRIPITPTRQLFQQAFRYTPTEETGIFALGSGGTILEKFVVNLDARESQTARGSEEELEALHQRAGIRGGALRTIASTEEMKKTILESRFGVELWKYFLMFGLIVALTEMLVAHSWKREEAQSSHD